MDATASCMIRGSGFDGCLEPTLTTCSQNPLAWFTGGWKGMGSKGNG